ncbi:MAG: hypothetical protein J1E64_08940 [Acetatifactor sp.]|nr:hypothetical protein [Acetatifactor sp.]
MSFVHAETEYEKQHKRSDHRLRKVPQEKEEREQSHKKYPMEGYEASEEELRQKAEPTQQVLLKGGGRRFSAGYNREQKLTMVFSKDEGKGRTREEEIFRAEGSEADPVSPLYMHRSSSVSTENAQILKDSNEKQMSYLLRQLKIAAEASDQTLLSDEFSFLSTSREKEQIQMLEETKAKPVTRAQRETDQQLETALRRDIAHKEEEQRILLEALNVQVKPEKEKKQKSLWEPKRTIHTTVPQADEAEGDPADEGGSPDKGNTENSLA